VTCGLDTTFLVQAEVREHPGHRAARALLHEALGAGERLLLAPQVLTEFVHVVTDGRRFSRPLTVGEAVERAGAWWRARDIGHAFPDAEAVRVFLAWMGEHRLGRKRVLDTLLAATYSSAGAHAILTSNARDYGVFGCFEVRIPAEPGV
jgi:predicted nucleic acid-binding protein